MARKPKCSVYEKIEKVKEEITETKEHLIELELQLEELKEEADKLEMERAWEIIKDKGITVEELQDLLFNMK